MSVYIVNLPEEMRKIHLINGLLERNDKKICNNCLIWNVNMIKPEIITGTTGLIQGANKRNQNQLVVQSFTCKRKLFSKFMELYKMNSINDKCISNPILDIKLKILSKLVNLKEILSKIYNNNQNTYYDFKKMSMSYYPIKKLLKSYFKLWTLSKRKSEYFVYI